MPKLKIVIVDGEQLIIPSRIYRYSHGWQARYRGIKCFTDSRFGGIKESLEAAKNYLKERVALVSNPIKLKLHKAISPLKKNDLPIGISG